MHKVEASTEEEAIDAPVACEVPHLQFSQIIHVMVTLQRPRLHVIIHVN